ncbi:chitinase 2 [Lathyrus oleraceus]|nr:chitinase 2-like [Pisum sativum]
MSIFREYIGVKPNPITLDDFPSEIINPLITEFHFILGFAKEEHDQNGKGTGQFKPTWNMDYFSPEKVKKLKEKHENVRVVISFGGQGEENSFNPFKNFQWSINAANSLKVIIQDYNKVKDNLIDGIDVHYDYINSNEEDFSQCIGDVIKRLKNDISSTTRGYTSIAPSHLVEPHYKWLYHEYLDLIDLVDYQFYNHTLSSKHELTTLFNDISKDYDVDKLLVGISTYPADADKVPPQVFIDGCTELVINSALRGIFVWSANDSATNSNDKHFSMEEALQKIITDNPHKK